MLEEGCWELLCSNLGFMRRKAKHADKELVNRSVRILSTPGDRTIRKGSRIKIRNVVHTIHRTVAYVSFN